MSHEPSLKKDTRTEGNDAISSISAIAYGFMGSQALFAALELGLFTALSDEPCGLDALADKLHAPPGPLSVLLSTCPALGLLTWDGERYTNSPAAQRFLVQTSRSYIGDYYLRQISPIVYPRLPLVRSLLCGEELTRELDYAHTLADPKTTEAFVRGQHAGSLGPAALDARFQPGDRVMAHDFGHTLGISRHGGYSEYARVPGDFLFPLPTGLNFKQPLVLSAGLTAAMGLRQLEKNDLTPQRGPVLVTGATGGVGSLAVSLLSRRGYTVAASTGKADAQDYLRQLGASEILSRQETEAESSRPLEAERWAESIDTVGGATLAYLMRTTKISYRLEALAVYASNAQAGVQTDIARKQVRAVREVLCKEREQLIKQEIALYAII